MATIRFSNPGEFADELRLEFASDHLPGPAHTLRLTRVIQTTRTSAICSLSVVATIKALHTEDIIRLDTYCGAFMPNAHELDQMSNSARAIAKDAEDVVNAACADLGIEVRAGVLEP